MLRSQVQLGLKKNQLKLLKDGESFATADEEEKEEEEEEEEGEGEEAIATATFDEDEDVLILVWLLPDKKGSSVSWLVVGGWLLSSDGF
ncbi:hypothetical protein CJ030_MR3G009433 [Morella rubra]|uniref:Uncharacterized protein n=1 Tax=Morella rubra TaxID=262757 RepID=A0A6A1W989_9ROSI|nr:hypothetical protein CJ030_MR3G009433 [Morella rubra]